MSLVSANSSLTFKNILSDLFTTFCLQQNWAVNKSFWAELADLRIQVSAGK